MLGIERTTQTGYAKALEGASLEPLVHTPPLPQCEVCVIVPVRDEAENLVATLKALTNQVSLQGQRFEHARYEIIVLANNCRDHSAALARDFAQQHATLALHVVEITLPAAQAYIGRVRRILMDEAYRRLISIGRLRGVIASTDGDTSVAPTWIAATLHEINCGADAVGGRILTNCAERRALNPYARLCHLREVGYRYLLAELETYLDPDPYEQWPRHYQHFGASLAVTAQMYAKVGGLPPVRTPEDVALYQALVRVDARFRHSPQVQVVTSARQTGRAKNGLANQLHEWTSMGRKHQPFLVESVAAIEKRLHARRKLRLLWERSHAHSVSISDVVAIANVWQVAPEWLHQQLQQPSCFGLLVEQITQQRHPLTRSPQMEITQAIWELRQRLARLRRTAPRSLDALEHVKPILFFPLSQEMSQLRIS